MCAHFCVTGMLTKVSIPTGGFLSCQQKHGPAKSLVHEVCDADLELETEVLILCYRGEGPPPQNRLRAGLTCSFLRPRG